MTDKLKAFLYKTLGLKNYLRLLQMSFVIGYKTGLLKSNPIYQWHYFVKNIIQPGDNIIDIGANLGYFSLIFSKLTGNNGKLYSVEPVKPYRDLLTKLLANKNNTTIYPYALGNTNEGTVKLGMPPLLQHLQYLRHGTVTILSNDAIKNDQLVFEADIKKGSEVFASFEKLDYIKCDIEGYETVVLPEIKPVLEKHKPLVQLETWGEQLPIMLAYFKQLGFDAYHLENNKLVNCNTLSLAEIAASDILFVHPLRKDRLKKWL